MGSSYFNLDASLFPRACIEVFYGKEGRLLFFFNQEVEVNGFIKKFSREVS